MSIFDSKTWFLLSGIIFIISTDLSVVLGIPLLQQILGFIFLAFFPGFLILNLMKPEKISKLEEACLAVGLSIAFCILFGLFLNILLPSLGNNQPLSTISILSSFSVVFLILLFSGYLLDRHPVIGYGRISFTLSEKLLAITLILVFFLSILGIYLLNTYNLNYTLLTLFIIIPVVVAVIVLNNRIPSRFYPVALFFISVSLVLLYALRSNHLLGVDIHDEFYFFISTLNASKWVIYPNYLLSGTLSISLFPVVFSQLLNIDNELLFKVLYPILYSITPLIVYSIAKKYLQDSYAFIAACFFIFQYTFIRITVNTRTSIAIIFVALSFLILLNCTISSSKKRILLIIFFASMILSHYTTSYIFFAIILVVFICESVIQKINSQFKFEMSIKFSTIFIFLAIMLLWYGLTGSKILNYGISFLQYRNQILLEFLNNDLLKYSANTFNNQGFLISLANNIQYIAYLLIGLGVLWILVKFVKPYLQESGYHDTTHKNSQITVTHLLIASISFGLLVLIFFTPFVFALYDTGRIQPILFVTLSGFLVIGCIFVVIRGNGIIRGIQRKYFSKGANPDSQKEHSETTYSAQVTAILLIILIVQLFSVTGVIYQVSGYPRSIILNSPDSSQNTDFGPVYIYDQDSSAAAWLKANILVPDAKVFADPPGIKKLTSQTGLFSMLYSQSVITAGEPVRSTEYLYLSNMNVKTGRMFDFNGPAYHISLDHAPFFGKNKIYDGGSQIFK